AFWNQGAERMYGWPREDALGKDPNDLLQTRFPKPFDQIEAELLREGHWEGELVHHRRDGTPVVAASRWALQRDAGGGPLAILEINHDITERKRIEEALARERNLLRTLMDNLPDHVFVKDTQSRFVTANVATLRALRVASLDRVVG